MNLVKSWLSIFAQPTKTRFYVDTEGNLTVESDEDIGE